MLEQNYAIRSANSMLAALNAFLRFVGWNDLCVKQFKVQKEPIAPKKRSLAKQNTRRLSELLSKRKTNVCPWSFKPSAEQAFVSVNWNL